MTLCPLFVSLAGAVLCVGQAGDGPARSVVAKEEAAFKAVAAAVAPSVVRIETLGGVDTADGRLLGSGPTTGTVVREDGLILTSSEAFAGEPTSILVRLPDGRRVAAERLGEDEARQLTLLRIELPEDDGGVVPAVPAAVDALRVGDWAIAVGRTFSAENVNVSVGVVSAKDRILGRAVQSDAKISPANYGGPLVDLAGRTIGILSPLSADGGSGGVEWYDSGIGFAVPLADMLPVLDRLAKGDTLRPGQLGVTFKGAGLDAEPVVDSVRPLSPADEAGVKPGDRLVTVAGRSVSRPDEAKLALGPLYAGDEATLVVNRDGDTVELTATLAADLPAWRPGDLGVLPADPAEPAEDDDGLPVEAGVQIAHFFSNSAADGTLSVDDVVTAVGGEAVATAEDLRRIVTRRLPGTEVMLTLAGGESVAVTIGEPPTAPPGELPETVDPAADPLPADESGRLKLEVPGFDNHGGALLVPARAGRGGFALLVCPPAAGLTAPDELFKQLGPFAERHGVILMFPRPAAAAGFQPGDLPFVAAAVEQVREQYAVEASRTALFGRGKAGRTVWQIATADAGVYRGIATDAVPGRLPENNPDNALVPLLLGEAPENVRAVMSNAGYPLAVLEGVEEDAETPLSQEAAGAIVRWVTTLDRI